VYDVAMSKVSPRAALALEFVSSRKRRGRTGRVWTDAYAVGCAVFQKWEGPTTGRTDEAVVLLKELFAAGLVECDSSDLGSYNAKWRIAKRGDG
jgi:hypothetical protein